MKAKKMTTKALTKFFKDNAFNVFKTKQDGKLCAELEKWTSGGVDMIIWLNPFTKEEFISYVNDFDIDEEITLNRQNKQYCNDFTIRQSVDDFEEFQTLLKSIAEKL